MSDVTIHRVEGKRDLKRFIKFPWKIYENEPMWVPPLLMDRRKIVDTVHNPFYRHADLALFLASRDGELVGRIGAIMNYAHNQTHGENVGFYGFFESINDQEVANSLFDAAREWLKSKGATAMRGPANPSVNDDWGLLIEGFEYPPVIMMPYNPRYYIDLTEGYGLRKIKDLYAYHLSKDRVISDKLVRVAEAVKQREGLHFRTINMRDFDNEVNRIKEIYNRAWAKNWGAVAMTDEEFYYLAEDLKKIVIPELVIIAESKGKPIGFALSIPDLNMALKYNKKGRLIPGMIKLLLHKKEITWLRIIVLGVIPEYQRGGAASVLFYETARRGIELGYADAEAGWVLEDNLMMNRSAELLNAELYKKYRLYEIPIPA